MTRRRGAGVALPTRVVAQRAFTPITIETSRPRSRSPTNRGRPTTAVTAVADDETVEPIHQSAMAGNEMAGILDAGAPLHRGFEEIAELRDNGDAETQQRTCGTIDRRRGAISAASSVPSTAPRSRPISAPDQVLPGETLGHSFGPPIKPSAEIGHRRRCPRRPRTARGSPAVHRRGSRAAARCRRPARRRRGRPAPAQIRRAGSAMRAGRDRADAQNEQRQQPGSRPAPCSAKGEAATSATTPTQTRAHSRVAADQPLPFPEDEHGRRDQPEQRRNGNRRPRRAPSAIAISMTPGRRARSADRRRTASGRPRPLAPRPFLPDPPSLSLRGRFHMGVELRRRAPP